MSYKARDRVDLSGLPTHLKHLASVLASFANHDGTAIRPSVATLVTRVGIKERQIQNGLTELVALGCLRIVRKGGGRWPTEYALDFDLLPPFAGAVECTPEVHSTAPDPLLIRHDPSENENGTVRTVHAAGASTDMGPSSDPSDEFSDKENRADDPNHPSADVVRLIEPLARQSFQDQPHLSWVDRLLDVERRAADLGLVSSYQARRRAIFHVEEERNGHRPT